MNFSTLTIDEFIKNQNELIESLKIQSNWTNIPMLNQCDLHHLPDNSFVRFRGMIQDMLDPEIYYEQCRTVCNGENGLKVGKYRDTLTLKPEEKIINDDEHNRLGERMSMFMVTIPGFNEWANHVEKEQNCLSKIITPTEAMQGSSLKRPLVDEPMEMGTDDGHSVKKLNTSHEGKKKEESNELLSAEYLLNSPIPDRPSKACIVKVYEDFNRYTLNTVYDILGFLSVDPALDGSQQCADEFEELTEIQATNPPPSLIPRLHAIYLRPVSHLNPHTLNDITNDTIDGITLTDIFKDLKLILTQCMFGDHVAATYMMCHLISTVYVRSELETLGQFCLNLSNIPTEVLPDYTKYLYEVIELLLPASHYLPMTLENMNTLQFSPKKDYTTNKLTSGLLQLAPHTHIVLDETRLLPGKLENNGIAAVTDIAHLINNQKIKCDYKFYPIEFNVDIPVLILSEGKSMLPSGFHLPIKPEQDCIPLINETIQAAKQFLRSKLKLIAKYLTYLKIAEFNMDSDNLEMIQNDFVEMRRNHQGTSAEDLHSLLVLSRLLGLCQGSKSISTDYWNQAKQLEKERKDRINLMPKRK